MAMRGWARPARANGLVGDEAAVELRVVGRRHVRRRHVGVEQRGKELGGRLAGLALPHGCRPAPSLPASASASAASTWACRRSRQSAALAGDWNRCFERPQRRLQRLHELARRLPVVALQPAHAAGAGACPRADRPAPAPAPPRHLRAPGRSRARGRRRARARARPRPQLLPPAGRAGTADASAATPAPPARSAVAAASTIKIEEGADGVSWQTAGRPESSTARPQASSRTATRRASARSGVTSAAVRPGVSATSRRMRAIGLRLVLGARRLQDGDAVERPAPSRRLSASAMKRCQRSVVLAGRMASLTSAARARSATAVGARPGQTPAPPRAAPPARRAAS